MFVQFFQERIDSIIENGFELTVGCDWASVMFFGKTLDHIEVGLGYTNTLTNDDFFRFHRQF